MKYLIVLLMAVSVNVSAWDGYDYEAGSHIEIGQGNLVRHGTEIEVYDYGTSSYKDYTVESVNSTEVEVYDYDTSTYKTFEMY